MSTPVTRASGLAALAAAMWALAGCDAVRHEPPLNVLFITLDTTRADHIGAYGAAVQTPALDRLAREGIVFEQASAAAPFTLPAHASIFTGRLPMAHAVHANGGLLASKDQTTLAEVLKTRGYATAAFVGSYVLDSIFGLDQGFDTYVDDFAGALSASFTASSLQRPADEVADRALTWLRVPHDAPFLAWLHFYDAHAPYEPPEPYRSVFASDPYTGEIAFVDAQIGRVLDDLRDAGQLERTAVVVIGDHGEALGDHGEATHGRFLYESVMRVPFIVRLPSGAGAGRRVRVPVSAADVMPTVLDVLGIAAPADVDGRSLRPLIEGQTTRAASVVYAEAPSAETGANLRMLREGSLKLIVSPRLELYDLSLDPAEERNLATGDSGIADRLLQRLRALDAHGGGRGAHESTAARR